MVDPHATDEQSFERCSRCDGSGLALNDNGEPDDCPVCKGDTVTPAPLSSKKVSPLSLKSITEKDVKFTIHPDGELLVEVDDGLDYMDFILSVENIQRLSKWLGPVHETPAPASNRRFTREFDEWNEVSGVPKKGTSWHYEMRSIIEDADKEIECLSMHLAQRKSCIDALANERDEWKRAFEVKAIESSAHADEALKNCCPVETSVDLFDQYPIGTIFQKKDSGNIVAMTPDGRKWIDVRAEKTEAPKLDKDCGHVGPDGSAYRYDNCPYLHNNAQKTEVIPLTCKGACYYNYKNELISDPLCETHGTALKTEPVRTVLPSDPKHHVEVTSRGELK